MELGSIYTVVVLTATMMGVIYMLFTLMLKLRNTKYDEEKRRIELEIMRRTLEENVYKETDRLTSNYDRWRDVNHLLLDSIRNLDKKIDRAGYERKDNRFLSGVGVDNYINNIRKNSVFVLTPFHPKYEKTYEVIARSCDRVGLKCSRGDEKFIRGGVLSHILSELLTASVVIANIDGRNPNVFYELGIAHALDKDVIIVSSSINEVPFDLKSQRLVVWNNPEELDKELNRTLTRLLVES